jgi:hypothetical protein
MLGASAFSYRRARGALLAMNLNGLLDYFISARVTHISVQRTPVRTQMEPGADAAIPTCIH